MILLDINITHFGKFHDKFITFERGMNVFNGQNEAGKSTIHAFIIAMLFGIKKDDRKTATIDDYSHYVPWEDEGGYEGVLRFEHKGISYRIERSFLESNKYMRLFNETENKELKPAQEQLYSILGNINEVTFNNTISISQMKAKAESSLADELKRYMTNIKDTGSIDIDLTRAKKELLKKKSELMKKKSPKLKEEMDKNSEAKEKLEQELHKIMQSEDDIKKKRTALEEKQKTYIKQYDDQVALMREDASLLQRKLDETEGYIRAKEGDRELQKKSRVVPFIFLGIAIICFGLSIFFYVNENDLKSTVFIAGIGIVTAGVFWLINSLCIKNNNLYEIISAKKGERDQLLKEYSAVEDGINTIDKSNIDNSYTQISENDEELKHVLWNEEQKREELFRTLEAEEALHIQLDQESNIDNELKAVDLAMETMEKLSSDIHETYGTELNSLASNFFSLITDGKYDQLVIEEDMRMYLNTSTKLMPVECVSRGTIEQAYLALRLAAAKILWQDEDYPIILDDVFVHYDDERVKRTLNVLRRMDAQVIIFTCQNREREFLEG